MSVNEREYCPPSPQETPQAPEPAEPPAARIPGIAMSGRPVDLNSLTIADRVEPTDDPNIFIYHAPDAPPAPKEYVPEWRTICGIDPDLEHLLTARERRAALLQLYQCFDSRVRLALDDHDQNRGEFCERTFLWDPVPMLCAELGLARRRLSAYLKELTGMSAHDLVDRARAERLRAAFEAEAATPPAPRMDRAQWAIAHGFPNYARMRRGCMLAHGGRPPHVLLEEARAQAAPCREVAPAAHATCESFTQEPAAERQAAQAPSRDEGNRVDAMYAEASQEMAGADANGGGVPAIDDLMDEVFAKIWNPDGSRPRLYDIAAKKEERYTRRKQVQQE